jgi:methionyl-tRNA formyltransferase
MRIVLIGQAAFGEKVLAAILAIKEEVVGVFCPPDPPGKTNPLKQLAEASQVPVYQPKKMRDPEAYEIITSLKPDLNVMAFVTDIVPDKILNVPRLGTIQYHPSILPKHRGGSAINWAIINGETRTGLSIFWPDQGIDTGPILLQKEVEIGPDDTTGSLYFNKLFPLGVEALVEAVQLARDGKAPRIVQDETQATYEPLCKENLTGIDWEKPADQIYNLIRGSNPQPGAVTTLRGQRLKIFDCRKQNGAESHLPGEVVAIEGDGFWAAAKGGQLFIQRVQPENSAKIKAAEFINVSGLKVGDRLGS